MFWPKCDSYFEFRPKIVLVAKHSEKKNAKKRTDASGFKIVGVIFDTHLSSLGVRWC